MSPITAESPLQKVGHFYAGGLNAVYEPPEVTIELDSRQRYNQR